MKAAVSYGLAVVTAMCLGLSSILPCQAIHMKGEGKKMTEEELSSLKIVREGRALEIMEGKDLNPPAILHELIRNVKPGKTLTVAASISDESGVASAALHYRTVGQQVYDSVGMDLRGENVYVADIPDFIVINGGVEYFIRAVDSAGNAGYSGSEGDPHRATVSSGPGPASNGIAFLFLVIGLLALIAVPRCIHRKASIPRI